MHLQPPAGPNWVGLYDEPISADQVGCWATSPSAGAVVTFSGTVRDHSTGRVAVNSLTYEAYEEPAVQRMGEVIDEARRRWPDLQKVAVLHRVGRLAVSEVAVVVAVSSAHRTEAFEAASFCIDTVKATVPLWKRETWADGDAWGTDAVEVSTVAEAATAGAGGTLR